MSPSTGQKRHYSSWLETVPLSKGCTSGFDFGAIIHTSSGLVDFVHRAAVQAQPLSGLKVLDLTQSKIGVSDERSDGTTSHKEGDKWLGFEDRMRKVALILALTTSSTWRLEPSDRDGRRLDGALWLDIWYPLPRMVQVIRCWIDGRDDRESIEDILWDDILPEICPLVDFPARSVAAEAEA